MSVLKLFCLFSELYLEFYWCHFCDTSWYLKKFLVWNLTHRSVDRSAPLAVAVWILTTWNFNNDVNLSSWIGEQPCMQMNFWLISRNGDITVISGKLSEIHLHAWFFSNLLEKVLKSIKSTGQISPILLRRKCTFPVDCRTTIHTNEFLTIF